MTAPFNDSAPIGDDLTDYDREHMKLYLRLLDAEADGAAWQEVVRLLFGIDPDQEPQRAQDIHYSHLERARWMTEKGYMLLLRRARD